MPVAWERPGRNFAQSATEPAAAGFIASCTRPPAPPAAPAPEASRCACRTIRAALARPPRRHSTRPHVLDSATFRFPAPGRHGPGRGPPAGGARGRAAADRRHAAVVPAGSGTGTDRGAGPALRGGGGAGRHRGGHRRPARFLQRRLRPDRDAQSFSSRRFPVPLRTRSRRGAGGFPTYKPPERADSERRLPIRPRHGPLPGPSAGATRARPLP